jgi:hypothetical protein
MTSGVKILRQIRRYTSASKMCFFITIPKGLQGQNFVNIFCWVVQREQKNTGNTESNVCSTVDISMSLHRLRNIQNVIFESGV